MTDTKKLFDSKFGVLRAQWNSHLRYFRRYAKDIYPMEKTLYHYTDLNGLIGILSGKGFWLSEAVFLNDSEELFNGVNLSISLIDKLINKKRYADFSPILSEVRAKLEKRSFKNNYIASFSLKRDDLEQWRSYASNGNGVCIGFDTAAKTKYPHFEIGNGWQLKKVIYSDKVKVMMLHSIIFKYYWEFKKDILNDNKTIDIFGDDYIDGLCESLESLFLIFKNPAFSSESEVRLIYNLSDVSDFFKNKRYRVVNNVIVPYVVTSESKLKSSEGEPLSIDNLPVSEIIVGPTIAQKEKVESIKYFLDDLGYSESLVVSSSIPYRG